MATTTAQDAFLGRDTPVTAALRPYTVGEQDWDATLGALTGIEWADRPKATEAQLMGEDGGGYVRDLEPGQGPDAGSWAEMVAARDLGIVTADELGQVLRALVTD